MNRRQAKGAVKHAAIIAAFAEGRIIELKSSSGLWVVTESPSFSESFEYRVKPEPRHLWRVENPELGWKCWGNFTKEDDAHRALVTATSFGDEGYVVNEYVQVVK